MEWLNYHHLLYFWTVARTGSVTRVSRELGLAQSTVSGQIRTLEEALGEKLLTRAGRQLVLTDVGQVAYRYADEIFSLGREMLDAMRGRTTGRPLRLRVGVADVLEKQVTYRLLEPALSLPEPVQLSCREDRTDRLLAELAIHELDLVLADEALGSSVRVRAYNHLLGECGISFVGTPELAKKYRRKFPQSLEGAPLLMPTEGTSLRRNLEHWLEALAIRPQLVADFDDSALLKVFGAAGKGLFAVPDIVCQDVCTTFGLRRVGHTDEVKERVYAISVERRIQHPAVAAITEQARTELYPS